MRISLFFLVFSFTVGAAFLARAAWAQEAGPATACLSQSEMRETVPGKHLTEPYRVTKRLSSEYRADAVDAKLCRQGDRYIYEITLVPRASKVVLHVSVDAVTEQILSGKPIK